MTNTDVRNYIAGLTSAELKTLIAELKADFAAPDSVTFATSWILGSSDHSHQISMSDVDFEALKNGQSVVKTTWSSVDHTHEVTFTYSAGVVSVSIADNHVGNLHTLNADDGVSDVVTEYIPAL